MHGAKAEEFMAHLDSMVETMQTPRKALEDAAVKQDPSVAEQEEAEEKYKDTLSKVKKMTKAINDLAYDASCCATKSKAVLNKKPYL